MASKMGVSTLVVGMFITGCANSLLTKYQDKQCVEHCEPGSSLAPLQFEQPVWQTVKLVPSGSFARIEADSHMFVGEFLCVLGLAWTSYSKSKKLAASQPQVSIFTRIMARLPVGAVTPSYHPVGQDDDSSEADEEETEELDVKLDEDNALTGWRMLLMWFPAFFDICGTTLMNVGLIFTPVSIYQMSRGSLVLFVGALSVVFLRRQLYLYQWASLLIVTTGVCLVGLSGSLVKKALDDGPKGMLTALSELAKRSDDDPGKVALGVLLILFAQNFTATQYVVEERIMSRYKVEPIAAVSLEGFFGLVTTLVAMPVLHFFFRDRSDFFDIPRGWHQIVSNPAVIWSSVAICISIGSFNFFGLSVTSRVSATTRSTVDTCRTLGIWIVSLSLGWEVLVWPFSVLQVAGFGLLVYGTFVFNGLLKPLIFEPPAGIHLPHEPDLEETGEVPAASGQARAGYDVLPEHERPGE